MEKRDVYKVEDIYKLHLGLMKYIDYGDKVFAVVVYDYMNAIKDIVDKLKEVSQPIDDFIEGLKAINAKYVNKEGVISPENIEVYKSEIARYREMKKEVIDREQEIRDLFRAELDKDIEISLPKMSWDVVPSVFTAQDIEHFRIVIDK